MAQVKFYAKTSLPTSGIDENGVYFIQNGELYKGSQRFGLGRITKATTAEELAALTDAARGDINVGFEGAKVYDGSAWQKLGGDVADIRAVVSSMTNGLVAGGTGSYITGIMQDPEGNVIASAEPFPALGTGDADGQVKLGNNNATVSGWESLVSSVQDNASNITSLSTTVYNLSTSVQSLETSVSTIDGSVSTLISSVNSLESVVNSITQIVDTSKEGGRVTASTGNFTNLNVTDTATFSGSTIGQIADARIAAISATTKSGSDSAAGITVGVTTQSGAVTTVTVDGPEIATSIAASGTASDSKVASEKAVRDAISSLDNAMHFKGVVTSLPEDGEPGDIVVIGTGAASPLAEGQEYICTASATTDPAKPAVWEKIGDQHSVTGGTGTSTLSGVTVEVVTAAATAAPTVSLTGVGTAATKDIADTVSADATTLPTCSAVASYVTGITNTKARVGTGTATGAHGISGEVVLTSNAQPTLTITVNAASTKADVSDAQRAGQVVTAGAVNDFVADAISAATTYDHGQEKVTADADTLDEAMHAVAGAIDAYVGGTASSSAAGITTQVSIDASAMSPSVTMSVNAEELKSALGLGAAASMGITTSLSGATNVLPTDAAVKTYVDTALSWITD